MILEYHVMSECEQNLLDIELECRYYLDIDLFSQEPFANYNHTRLNKKQLEHLVQKLLVFHSEMEE